MPDTLIKPYAVAIPELLKAVTGDKGEWIVSGPITPKGEDYDGDIIDDPAVQKGLTFFDKLGKHVDWHHGFAKTHNPKYLIGKGVHFKGPDGRTWLKTILDKSNEFAQELWKKANSEQGFACGYSLEGLLKGARKDAQGRQHITDTEIHRITIDPSPKGYGNYLQVGVPAGSFAGLSKSIAADFADGGDLSAHGWMLESEFPGFNVNVGVEGVEKSIAELTGIVLELSKAVKRDPSYDPKHADECCPHCGARQEHGDDGNCNRCGKEWAIEKSIDEDEDGGGSAVMPQNADRVGGDNDDDTMRKAIRLIAREEVAKALTTGAGIVQDGDTGGSALRAQTLAEKGAEQVRCPECGAKNLPSRKKCRKCGHEMTMRKAVDKHDTHTLGMDFRSEEGKAKASARIKVDRAKPFKPVNPESGTMDFRSPAERGEKFEVPLNGLGEKPAVAEKPAHEMTRHEYVSTMTKQAGKHSRDFMNSMGDLHQATVEDAVQTGAKVPAHVLADYPHLNATQLKEFPHTERSVFDGTAPQNGRFRIGKSQLYSYKHDYYLHDTHTGKMTTGLSFQAAKSRWLDAHKRASAKKTDPLAKALAARGAHNPRSLAQQIQQLTR